MNNINLPVDEERCSVIDTTPATLVSMNSKLFLITLLAISMNIVQVFFINSANERAETNTELMFVKMYPNATWDVEYRKTGEEADFFPLTIDKLIHDYVEARYGVRPATIRRDYGFALVFMSEALGQNFIGTGSKQYDAAKQADELAKKRQLEDVDIRFTDHFDVSTGTFVNGNSDVYRTNIFIERTITKSDGTLMAPKPTKEVITLHWRLKSFKELKKFTKDQLRANPIGLEIIKEKINIDVSSNH